MNSQSKLNLLAIRGQFHHMVAIQDHLFLSTKHDEEDVSLGIYCIPFAALEKRTVPLNKALKYWPSSSPIQWMCAHPGRGIWAIDQEGQVYQASAKSKKFLSYS